MSNMQTLSVCGQNTGHNIPHITWKHGSEPGTKMLYVDNWFVGVCWLSYETSKGYGYTYMPRSRMAYAKYPSQSNYDTMTEAMRALVAIAAADWYGARQLELPLDKIARVADNAVADFGATV